ncbi:hypothetical protein B0O80DRAFT_104509 [Mortierella sp. GBAus27b]|nr:hypothetical protein B0O80DRAFT_104509 [Mortierella sp. GBAus27b]
MWVSKSLMCINVQAPFLVHPVDMTSSSTSVTQVPRPSPFDIPELAELIAQYLPNHDIVQCMAISKTVAQQLEPSLWRHVALKWSLPAPPTLARNRHQIRSLYIFVSWYDDGLLDVVSCRSSNDLTPVQTSSYETHHSIDSPQITGCTGFHQLQSIHIDVSERHLEENQILPVVDQTLQILQQCPTLTSITLPGSFLNTMQTPTFLDTLEHRLPHLQQLVLDGDLVVYDTGLRFFSVCFNHPQLIDLRCGFSIHFGSPEHAALSDSLLEIINDSKKKSIPDKQPTMSRIKTLILPSFYPGYAPDFLCTLLKDHLPNIERFRFGSILEDHNMELVDAFRDAVAQGCSKLQHAEFHCRHDDKNLEEATKGVTLGCKEWGLKSFRRVGFRFGFRKTSGMETLLNHHSSTLEEVELDDCILAASHVLARLFHECRNLRKVKIELVPNDIGSALDYEDMVSKEWICCDLKELHILLNRRSSCSRGDDRSSKGSYSEVDLQRRELVKKALGQIGRLSKLETLCLGIYQNFEEHKDFTLDHGGLLELAGLKKLRHFGLVEDRRLGMRQPEVEFMDSQWPQLEKVTFYGVFVSGAGSEPHWQWLRERQPRLEYCISAKIATAGSAPWSGLN